MTPSPDLAALRAAAQREIERHADRRLPGTWRLVRLSDLPGIAPICDQDHQGRTPIHSTVDGLYDCCPHPWIRVGYLQVADLLLAFLNQPSPAAALATETGPDPVSEDPTGAWT